MEKIHANDDDYDDEITEEKSKPVLRIDDVSSLLDLQTEFLKKKQTIVSTPTSYSEKYVNRPKNNILTLTKEEKRIKNELSEKRRLRIKKNEEIIRNEEAEIERRKTILAEKERIYNRMSSGETLVNEDGKSADFLVDFTQKMHDIEQNASAKNVEEHKERSNLNPLVVHYNSTEDKGRVFGASHVQLPVFDEEARQQKITELKEMTEKTRIERAKRKKVRDEERLEERRRLNRLRKEYGLPPEESSSSSDEADEQSDEQKASKSITETNQSEEPPVLPSGPKKPKPAVREWDRGKTGYTRWIAAQREERDEEFKPPDFYYK